jgi:hypothetical protein
MPVLPDRQRPVASSCHNLSDGAILLGVQQIEDFFCHMGAIFPVAFLLETDLRLVVLTANE